VGVMRMEISLTLDLDANSNHRVSDSGIWERC
jgi:hypothetical protein